MLQLIAGWKFSPSTAPETVQVQIIACGSGSPASWDVAHALAELPCRTVVEQEAGSAGLFLFMAGEERLAHHGAQFLFHGNLYRWMLSGPSDEARAAWFAERTAMSYEWWFEKARINGPLAFGVDEALEWGVATGRVE
jgi:hypothetical protein